MNQTTSNSTPGPVTLSPTCSKCGSTLCGRLHEVRRERDHKLYVWLCGCGRRRKLRREVAAA
jgi:hypothetical protein